MKPIVLDEEFFFAILARDGKSVQIVARGPDEARVCIAGGKFLQRMPADEVGRYLVGSCERGASERQVLAEAVEAFRVMPPPSWAS